MSQGVRVGSSRVIDVDLLVARAHRLYASHNRPDRALATIDRALRLFPDHPEALVLRCQILTAPWSHRVGDALPRPCDQRSSKVRACLCRAGTLALRCL